MLSENQPCPCTSGLSYGQCCRPYHQGTAAPDALALMRSRYSAYALQLSDYIIRTTHALNPRYSENHRDWQKSILHFSKHTLFEGLKIRAFETKGDEAMVTFTAYLKRDGQNTTFTECSRFQKVEGQWLYLDGVIES